MGNICSQSGVSENNCKRIENKNNVIKQVDNETIKNRVHKEQAESQQRHRLLTIMNAELQKDWLLLLDVIDFPFHCRFHLKNLLNNRFGALGLIDVTRDIKDETWLPQYCDTICPADRATVVNTFSVILPLFKEIYDKLLYRPALNASNSSSFTDAECAVYVRINIIYHKYDFYYIQNWIRTYREYNIRRAHYPQNLICPWYKTPCDNPNSAGKFRHWNSGLCFVLCDILDSGMKDMTRIDEPAKLDFWKQEIERMKQNNETDPHQLHRTLYPWATGLV